MPHEEPCLDIIMSTKITECFVDFERTRMTRIERMSGRNNRLKETKENKETMCAYFVVNERRKRGMAFLYNGLPGDSAHDCSLIERP